MGIPRIGKESYIAISPNFQDGLPNYTAYSLNKNK